MQSQTVQAVYRKIQWFYHDKIHFLQLHYLYILAVMFIGSLAFYVQPGTNWSYVDALFMATTAVSNCGINTITMSDLTTWHVVVIYLLSSAGSHIVISVIILYIRRHYFSKRFEDVLMFNKVQRLREADKRKAEKNGRDKEKYNSKRLHLPLRQRLSFMSVRSVQKIKDEEGNYPSAPSTIKEQNHSLPTSFSYNDTRNLDNKIITNVDNYNEEHVEQSTQNLSSLPEYNDNETQPEEVVSTTMVVSPPLHSMNSPCSRKTVDDTNSKLSEHRPNSGYSLKCINDSILYNQGCSHLGDSLNCNNFSATSLGYKMNLNNNPNSVVQFGEINKENQQQQPQVNEGSVHTISETHGIAFAENIERQREVARRQLLQDRKHEDNSCKFSGDTDSTCATDTQYTFDPQMTMEADSDDEEMKRIMREPIHKSELTKQQRYRLGGAEYRAIVLLIRLVPFYYLFHVVGFGFIIRIYVALSSYAQEVLMTSNEKPVGPWLFSFFCSLSSFNNLGMSLLNSSMVPFQSDPFILLVNIVLVLAGYTAYAIFLRVIIWAMYKLTPNKFVMRRETLRYLLDHPRRCYTTLFPSTHTKWLLIVLVWITTTQFVSFIALNYWLPVLEHLDWGSRLLDGFFQAAATRNGKAGMNEMPRVQLD